MTLPRSSHRNRSTYDWFHTNEKNVTAYNSVLHLAMLAAAERIGEHLADAELVDLCRHAAARARAAIEKLLWSRDGRFLRAYASVDGSARMVDALHVDSLYGALWARRLALGWILDPAMIAQHLLAERSMAASKYGLLVMTNFSGDGARALGRDNMVWEAGSMTWSALAVELLPVPLLSALEPTLTVVNKYLDTLKDPWDWKDITAGPGTSGSHVCPHPPVDVDGQPWYCFLSVSTFGVTCG